MHELGFRHMAKWIIRNTVVTTSHLTPVLKLRLITPMCPLWMAQPDQCPFPDPYWAFYWPGGQALGNFLLNNPQAVNGLRVLDLGCGCGAVSIAALLGKPKLLIANDVDRIALVATALNIKLNNVPLNNVALSSEDLLLSPSEHALSDVDVVLLGDMFYDDVFGKSVMRFLHKQIKRNPGLVVLVGDPGRFYLKSEKVKLLPLATYALPDHVISEHYGFNFATVSRLLLHK